MILMALSRVEYLSMLSRESSCSKVDVQLFAGFARPKRDALVGRGRVELIDIA